VLAVDVILHFEVSDHNTAASVQLVKRKWFLVYVAMLVILLTLPSSAVVFEAPSDYPVVMIESKPGLQLSNVRTVSLTPLGLDCLWLCC
jgi:hypothetical protein